MLRRSGEETAVWPARFHLAATITTGTDGTIDDYNRRAVRLAATVARLYGRTETTAADRDEAESFGIGPLLADGQEQEARPATAADQ